MRTDCLICLVIVVFIMVASMITLAVIVSIRVVVMAFMVLVVIIIVSSHQRAKKQRFPVSQKRIVEFFILQRLYDTRLLGHQKYYWSQF